MLEQAELQHPVDGETSDPTHLRARVAARPRGMALPAAVVASMPLSVHRGRSRWLSTFTARAASWRRSGRRWIAVVCSGRQRLDRCCYLVQRRGIQGNVPHLCQLLAAQGIDTRYSPAGKGPKRRSSTRSSISAWPCSRPSSSPCSSPCSIPCSIPCSSPCRRPRLKSLFLDLTVPGQLT